MESQFFDTSLFRYGFYTYFRRDEYDCSGLDDILLIHKYYFNFNITSINICFGQCLVLVLGTRVNLTSSRRPISEWQSNHRPAISDRPSSAPTAMTRHGTDERCARRPSSPATLHVHRTWTFVKVDRQACAPTGQQNTTFPSDMRDAPTSRRQVREICRCCHCQPASASIEIRMRRSANGRNT